MGWGDGDGMDWHESENGKGCSRVRRRKKRAWVVERDRDRQALRYGKARVRSSVAGAGINMVPTQTIECELCTLRSVTERERK